jgi:uncharacterized membrane protein YkoI
MKRRTKALIAAGVLATGGIGAGVAVASGGNGHKPPNASSDHDAAEKDRPITPGSDKQHAKRVALAYVGEGKVTETEEGDEESYYEVEVTKDNGDQVDVQLDRDFNVVGSKTEPAGTDDKDHED